MDDDNRPEPPLAAPPKEMISAFMDFQRATLLWKAAGVSDEELRRPRTASGISLLGIIKHSAYVERWWFQRVFAGEDVPMPWSKEDPDADWRVEPHEMTDEILALYNAECARSREIVAAGSWDDRAKQHRTDHSLGWILTHMLEEISRHNGHADIFREIIDGKVGE